MNYKKTGAEKSTITRDLIELGDKTGNIYNSIAVIAKRSSQINRAMKDELINKLEEFATNNEQLEEVFDKIALQIEGYNFGRFDLRVSSEEDLSRGVNMKIMELNGANSEPAHIYDPKMPLITAYKALFRHWKNLFQVSVANHKLGVPYAPLFGTIKEVRSYFKNR